MLCISLRMNGFYQLIVNLMIAGQAVGYPHQPDRNYRGSAGNRCGSNTHASTERPR